MSADSRPDHAATQVSDFCECGHPRHLHITTRPTPRGICCVGQRDTRQVTEGGSNLSPCDCKQFKPMGFSNV